MNYWWTSDYHFSHANIIKYCGRPFETVEEMNETIIRKHNERVKPEDVRKKWVKPQNSKIALDAGIDK